MAGDDQGPKETNTRQHARGGVQIRAEIRESGQGGKQHISVLDLSQSGFRMNCPFYIPEDRMVFLTMPGFAPMEARIAWHRGHEYGCEFLQQLYPAVYEHILRAFPSLDDRS